MRRAWNKKYPDMWTCEQCSVKFPNKTGHPRKYCSYVCRNKAYKSRSFPTGFKKGDKHWNYHGNPISRDGTRFNYPMMRLIAENADYQCQICGFNFEKKPIYKIRHLMSFDHTKPIRLGGGHSVENGQLLCRTCNRAKTSVDRKKILHGQL